MKHFYFPEKNILILIFIFALTIICKANSEPIRPVKNNWANKMGMSSDGAMCVELSKEKMIYLNFHITVAVNEIDKYPPMRIKYTYETSQKTVSGMSNYVDQSMFHPYTTEEGTMVYKAMVPVYFDCADECAISGATTEFFEFKLSFNAVMPMAGNPETYEPYAFSKFPALWPSGLFELPKDDNELLTETKHICCPLNPESLMKDDGKMMTAANSSKIVKSNSSQIESHLAATPNPFSNDITIQYNAIKSSTSQLECYDVQGKIVKSFKVTAMHEGVQSHNLDLSESGPGIYYIRLTNGHEVFVVKVVKL
jgi:Secretion system C-terminal sorting domain